MDTFRKKRQLKLTEAISRIEQRKQKRASVALPPYVYEKTLRHTH